MNLCDPISFIVLGTAEFTLACAESIRRSGGEVRALVTLPDDLKPENSINLTSFAQKYNIELIEYSDLNDHEAVSYLKTLNVDYIFSTWPHLLSDEFISIPKKFVIGSHPTPLPIGRGRHALHWLTVLNRSETCISFFRMDSGIDTGKILFQKPFRVEERISDTNKRMMEAVYSSFPTFLSNLANGVSQSNENNRNLFSNYWRKRDFHDITLDPRMCYETAKRIVNSFLPPYSGARLYIGVDDFLVITNVNEVLEGDFLDNWQYREHGYIFQNYENYIMIRFDDAVLLLTLIQYVNRDLSGMKIRPPSYYLGK